MVFRNWVKKVPRSKDDVWPLGSSLAEFFQEASQLVDTDVGLMQAVSKLLAYSLLSNILTSLGNW